MSQLRGYSENYSMVTLVLFPVAATVGLWYTGTRPTAFHFIAMLAAFVGVQRFIAAGCRMPGKWNLRGTNLAAGKVAIVTGANTGIGFCTAVGLVEAGAATVVLTCRDEKKVREAVAAVREASGRPGADVRGLVLELNSLASVRRAADAFKAMKLPLHILINNAGAVVPLVNGTEDPKTVDGLEATFGGNFVGPYLLTQELLPLLDAARGRLVNVTARGHALVDAPLARSLLAAHPNFVAVPGYRMAIRAYCLSKLGNVLHARFVAAKYPNITTASLHPGAITTDIWRTWSVFVDRGVVGIVLRFLVSLVFKTCPEGAITTLHCALSDQIVSGAYYADAHRLPESLTARDDTLRDDFMAFAAKTSAGFASVPPPDSY